MEKNMLKEFWNYVEQQDTKIAKKVYNWLNGDNLSGIYVDGEVYYTELTCRYCTMPNYIYDYIERFMKRKGYVNLYHYLK